MERQKKKLIASKYKSTCKILGTFVLVLGLVVFMFFAMKILAPYLSQIRYGGSIDYNADFFFMVGFALIELILTCVLPTILFALGESLEFSEQILNQNSYVIQKSGQQLTSSLSKTSDDSEEHTYS